MSATDAVADDAAIVTPTTGTRRRVLLPLLVQPAVIAVVLAFFLVWLSSADLTAQELTTLDPSALLRLTIEHLSLTFVAAAIVLVVAVPLGVLLTRRGIRRAAPAVLAIANIGQAAPPIGLIVLLAVWLGLGYWAAIVALVLYAALPVLRNTMIGIQRVDPRLIEAGRGMGMSAAAVLFRVELPLAVPVLLSGVRTALVLLAGTAALGAFISAGGLGLLIITGVNLFLPTVLVSGALLIALLALAIDWLGRVVEVLAHPKGV
jgi:osmoprotectant transport system permease protein